MRAPANLRAVALLAALAGAACSRPHGPVRVEAVVVEEGALGGHLREAGLDAGAIEATARAALGRAGFALDRGGAGAYRAQVEVVGVRVLPDGGRPRVEIALAIGLTPSAPGPDAISETGTGIAAVAHGPAEAWRAAAEVAARNAADGLAVALAEDRKTDRQLIRDLESRDARVREHAVRALAERRSAEAVPALVARLGDDDQDVVQRAIGALALMRDPRAVKPLIDLSRRGEAGEAARLARIIGDIGGPEAEGYLLTLGSGHPDARVRRAAREALGEMAARAAGTAAVP